MAKLIENAAAVKAAAQAIDAAIVAKGGTTDGGLVNAAAAIAALPSGGGEPAYPHQWIYKNDDPEQGLADETHLWYYFPRGGAEAFAYFAAQFRISEGRYSDASTRFFTVDWGDGTVEEIAATSTLANKTLAHQYADAGEYEVVISDYEQVNLSMSAFSSGTQSTSNLCGGLAVRQAQIGRNEIAIGNVNLYGFGLLYVAFQNKLTAVGNNVFASSPWLREIDLSACTTIGYGTFSDCTSLTSIGDLGACTSIGVSAFYGCSSLVSLGDLGACTSIGGGAFQGCSSLTSITLPAVTALYNGCFRDCASLRSVSGLVECEIMEYSVFAGMNSLEYIGELSKLTSWGEYYTVDKLELVDFGTQTSAQVVTISGFTQIPARQSCVIRCADGDFYRSGSTLVPLT